MKIILLVLTVVVVALSSIVANASLDTGFDPNVNRDVLTIATQVDGKILIGGRFTSIGGTTRNRLARLNADGSLDAGFAPNVNADVDYIAVQENGQILIGGFFSEIGGVSRRQIARLNSDGTLDITFDPNGVNNSISGNGIVFIVPQADGRILIGGVFAEIGGETRHRIARLNANGSLDSSFNPNISNTGGNRIVTSIIALADGKIIIGGTFNTVGGETRNNIARLNADGTLDPSFNPNVNQDISAMATQEDGKILIGGRFTTVGGVSRRTFARLNVDGTLDADYDPSVFNSVTSIFVQPDGKAMIGGAINSIGGLSRNGIGRVNPDGSLDDDFDPNIINTFGAVFVFAIVPQADGKILIGGAFTSIGGEARNRIGRLNAEVMDVDVEDESLCIPIKASNEKLAVICL